MLKKGSFLLVLSALCILSGAEIFVGKDQKYKTVKSGIAALKEGDTLTIMPGRYFESVNWNKRLKNVTIRAKIRGTVLIHGDKPAPKFKRVPGYRFVYAADWKDNVTAVNERDSFRVYFPAAGMDYLEFNFGYWYKKDGKLYISTTDGKAPDKHHLTVSVRKGDGLKFAGDNCVVDGINFTGFYSHFRVSAWSGINGIQLALSKNSVIRNCAAFFNANGITMSGGTGNTIENCTAFANGSQSPSSGGNFIGWSGVNNTIKNCRSMYKLYTGGSQGPIGIRFYGVMKNCRVLNCITYGEDGINIKGSIGGSYAENNYNERHINVTNSRNNIFSHTNGYNRKDVSPTRKYKKADWPKHYADPDNHDFRPISAVKIGMPAKVKKGDFVLLPPKTYAALAVKADDVTFKTRSNGKRAVIKGGNISGKNITLDNLIIAAPLKISGSNITLSNCEVNARVTIAGTGVKVIHNAFKAAPDFSKARGFRHSNTGSMARGALVSLEGKVTFDGFPAGPNRIVNRPDDLSITGPFVSSVSDDIVNIEWWSSNSRSSTEIRWGVTPKCEKKAGQPFSGGNWHSMSLTGLKPGTKYYFKVNGRTPLRTHHSNEELAELDKRMKRKFLTSKVNSFTTLKKAPKPRVLRVKGPVISPTLSKAKPGDTVLIPGGTYSETLYIRSANVTLRNVPGQKVVIDGKRILDSGIIVENKPGTVIDGITIKELIGGGGAGIIIRGGSGITVRRCFFDGRSRSYTPGFINANCVKDLTVEHCMITRGFHGASFWRCPGLKVRNCIWLNNQINHFYVHNLPGEKFFFTKNVVFDNIPGKVFNPLLSVWHLECFNESSNCFFFRLNEDKRSFLSYSRLGGKLVRGRVTYPEYVKLAGKKKSSVYCDPKMAAMPRYLKFTSKCFDGPGAMPPPAEYKNEMQLLGRNFSSVELGLDKKNVYKPWDFKGFFATEKRCVKLGIGPDPKLFVNGVAK